MDVSPFVVGRALQANEALFGREETFALIHAALAQFGSVNLVGERRMGKTSLLNHLQDNPQHRPAPGTPPLLLARVDLQNITDARRFYGLAMRGILTCLLNFHADCPQASVMNAASGPLSPRERVGVREFNS